MGLQTAISQNQEQILIKIVRNLPPSRVNELLDFARFLEGQVLAEKLTQGEDSAASCGESDFQRLKHL